MGELSDWRTAYEAYFHASNMSLLATKQQQAFMYNRMGPELSMRLKGTVLATANLQDMFQALDAVFLKLHPLFER